MSWKLLGQDGTEFELKGGAFTLGRGSDCHILTPESDSRVSRHHARITAAGGELTIEDAGSANGTYVNGRRLKAPMRLNPGDIVRVGATRFQVVDGTRETAPEFAAPTRAPEPKVPEVLHRAPELVPADASASITIDPQAGWRAVSTVEPEDPESAGASDTAPAYPPGWEPAVQPGSVSAARPSRAPQVRATGGGLQRLVNKLRTAAANIEGVLHDRGGHRPVHAGRKTWVRRHG